MTNSETLKDYRENLKNSGNEIRNEESKNIENKDQFTEKLLEERERLQADREGLQEELNNQQNTIRQLNQSIDEFQTTIDSMKDNLNSLNSSSINWNNHTETNQQQITTETEQQQTTTETEQQQTTTETEQQQTTTETDQQQTTSETQGYEQPELKLNSYEWYVKSLSQLIFEIDWCIETVKYKKWLNQSWKETLKVAKDKLKQYKNIINGKKEHLEHEYKEKNKLNKKNPDKAPLTLSISGAEIDELENRRFQWRQLIEVDIKEWQNWKTSNVAPRPNQSLEQVKKWNSVDRHYNEYNSKLKEALNDAAFLRIIDNNQDAAREFLQGIANNSLTDTQIEFCQLHMNQLAPYFDKYGMLTQVHTCIQTRWWRYNQSVENYKNMDKLTAYKTWWITGWLNKILIDAFPNVKPEDASAISSAAVVGGWIYAVYRIWKWFFEKDKEWKNHFRKKAARTGWLWILAPKLLLWQDWFSIIWDLLSWKADFSEMKYRLSNCLWFLNNNSPEVYNAMTPGILWMNIFPMDYTVAHVRILQQELSTDPNKLKQRYTDTYNRLNKDDYALANEFKNTFNANKYDENERKTFLAKIWITDETNWNVKLFDKIKKITDKNTSFAYWMKANWKEINPEFKKEVDDYINKEWEFNPDELDPEWFKDNNNTTNNTTDNTTNNTTKEKEQTAT